MRCGHVTLSESEPELCRIRPHVGHSWAGSGPHVAQSLRLFVLSLLSCSAYVSTQGCQHIRCGSLTSVYNPVSLQVADAVKDPSTHFTRVDIALGREENKTHFTRVKIALGREENKTHFTCVDIALGREENRTHFTRESIALGREENRTEEPNYNSSRFLWIRSLHDKPNGIIPPDNPLSEGMKAPDRKSVV